MRVFKRLRNNKFWDRKMISKMFWKTRMMRALRLGKKTRSISMLKWEPSILVDSWKDFCLGSVSISSITKSEIDIVYEPLWWQLPYNSFVYAQLKEKNRAPCWLLFFFAFVKNILSVKIKKHKQKIT